MKAMYILLYDINYLMYLFKRYVFNEAYFVLMEIESSFALSFIFFLSTEPVHVRQVCGSFFYF